MTRLPTFLTAALLLTAASATVQATTICPPPAGTAVTLGFSTVATTSRDFAKVPDTTVNFTTSEGPRCVFLRFSAVAKVPAGEVLSLSVKLDSEFMQPGIIGFLGVEGATAVQSAHTFEFFLPDVPAGAHRVTIKWRTDNGQQVLIARRIVTVTF